MGLYSSFNPSDYYDDNNTTKKATATPTPSEAVNYSKPHTITTEKRTSLYAQAKEVATNLEKYKGPDFRDVYRVGQHVVIQSPNGEIRTSKGVIAEIVAQNLMYVFMMDAYKDANEQWLVDFVTDKDIITTL